MNVEIVTVPSRLVPGQLVGKVTVVFDILRATTTMCNALRNGAHEIRIYPSIEQARAGHRDDPSARKLLAGEVNGLPPAGFDLGNSPGSFTTDVVDQSVIHMATTNGTNAILAAREADRVLIASHMDLPRLSMALAGLNVAHGVMVCAGTNGQPSEEDVAVAELLRERLTGEPPTDKRPILQILRTSRGAVGLLAAGLEQDITFAAGSLPLHQQVVARVGYNDGVVRCKADPVGPV